MRRHQNIRQNDAASGFTVLHVLLLVALLSLAAAFQSRPSKRTAAPVPPTEVLTVVDDREANLEKTPLLADAGR